MLADDEENDDSPGVESYFGGDTASVSSAPEAGMTETKYAHSLKPSRTSSSGGRLLERKSRKLLIQEASSRDGAVARRGVGRERHAGKSADQRAAWGRWLPF